MTVRRAMKNRQDYINYRFRRAEESYMVTYSILTK